MSESPSSFCQSNRTRTRQVRIAATHTIHARDPGQHVVIYTGSDEYGDVARADDAGAVGYLHKDALTSPDLADALHVLHANYLNSVPDPD